jgi:hypothetical protein
MEALIVRKGEMWTEEAADAQVVGTVTAVTERGARVRTGEGEVEVKRAVSCLVEPEEGDLVLLVRRGPATPYLLAVLERPGGRGLRISAEGDFSIDARGGRLAVHGAEGVEVTSEECVSLAGERVEARGREASLFFGSVKLIAGAADSVLERLFQSVTRSFRRVEEVDHLRAGQIDHAAEGMVRLHGGHTLMTARELVKTDAKQIHVG